MILFKAVAALQRYLLQQRKKGKTIGFVPTMGALHSGHTSLIAASRNQSDITVCSIFVNPTQFNNPDDFVQYPSTISNDILILEQQQCDVLFMPSVPEVYPAGAVASKTYAISQLETILEGAFRPGHFQGVCQVVDRLLQIVQPDFLFLGQKDYQQTLVLKAMIAAQQLPLQVVVSPTLREPSGLALSSRNLRLSQEEKAKATAIYTAMQRIQSSFTAFPFRQLESSAEAYLITQGFTKVDYVSIADARHLQPAVDYNENSPLVVLVAAYMGTVRLIDNLTLSPFNGDASSSRS